MIQQLMCVLCVVDLTEQNLRQLTSAGDRNYIFNCPNCGKYALSEDAFDDDLRKLSPKDRACLAVFSKEREVHQLNMPIFLSNLEAEPSGGKLLAIRISRVFSEKPFPEIEERVNKVLLSLATLGPSLGDKISITGESFPLFCCENTQALWMLIDYMSGRVMIKRIGTDQISILPAGWARIADLRRGLLAGQSKQAFVAMWFDPTMDEAYTDAIAHCNC